MTCVYDPETERYSECDGAVTEERKAVKKVRNVYVVMAVSGMYEDYNERPIAAYLKREFAEKHRRAAAQWWVDLEDSLDAKGIEMSDLFYSQEGPALWKANPWDGEYVYMNPEYTIVEIPLRGSARPANEQKAEGKK